MFIIIGLHKISYTYKFPHFPESKFHMCYLKCGSQSIGSIQEKSEPGWRICHKTFAHKSFHILGRQGEVSPYWSLLRSLNSLCHTVFTHVSTEYQKWPREACKMNTLRKFFLLVLIPSSVTEQMSFRVFLLAYIVIIPLWLVLDSVPPCISFSAMWFLQIL